MKKFVLSLILLASLLNPVYANQILKLATTTSTDDSGLLKKLLPPFEKKYNVQVNVIAVGSGKAIKLGENGDVDVLLVHDRDAEDKFVLSGYGINRKDVMYNDFVVIGPKSDPAKVKKSKDIVDVFKKIAKKYTIFISRGDQSGTNSKELKLWKMAKIDPKNKKWYLEIGQGMGATLLMANEKQGYTLTDRGTFIAYRDKLNLVIVYEKNKSLFNNYGVIAVNPTKYKKANYKGAMLFINWITSNEGQSVIKNFKLNGEQLFYPVSGK